MLMVVQLLVCSFFSKQKTSYEMRISDWSSDVCSSDLVDRRQIGADMLRREREFDKGIIISQQRRHRIAAADAERLQRRRCPEPSLAHVADSTARCADA